MNAMNMAPPPTQRVLRLRERYLEVSPSICPDRALIMTRIFQDYAHEPVLNRWAIAFDAVLREMRIYIAEDELLVGNQASSPMAAPLFPEASVDWLEEDLFSIDARSQDPFQVPQQVKQAILEILPFWRERSMEYEYLERRSKKIAEAEESKSIRIKSSGGIGHHLLNLNFVLEHGFERIKQIIREKISRHNGDADYSEQVQLWYCLVQTCDSILAYTGRFAEEALTMAAQTSDVERKGELTHIARVCKRVPQFPAASFHEALQCIWFLTVIAHIFQSGGGITLGRLDQVLQPYLDQDIETGVITLNEAQELLDCLWLKLQDLNVARSSEIVTAWAGYEVNPTVNIGGQTISGEDATNDISYMCLIAEQHIHMRNPQLILRIHEGTPQSLWLAAIETIKAGGGKPSLISDRVCMKALSHLGVPDDELLDYSIIGCAEPTVGDSRMMIRWAWLCLPKVLELTLHNGVDPRTGLQVGLKTGAVHTFPQFDDLLTAFIKQVKYQVELITSTVNNVADPLVAEMMPHLPLSLITPNCIEQGIDLSIGGADRTWSVIWPIAPTTTANSLAAIRTQIFHENTITWGELLLALEQDFGNHEILQHRLIRSPKFGNDDRFVDDIARAVVHAVYDAVETRTNNFGGPFTTGFITLGANVHYGRFVGATPDGRHAGQPLSDGMSPSQGTEFEGPTATLKSVAKLDLTHAGSGGILNLKFNPALLMEDSDIQNFIYLNETYLNDLGGLQVQYNVISTDVLREAQANPEAYRDLLVRVVGYCARFVDLSPEVQEDIISRTEHHHH
jgi:pyruvate formate-lyase/glycerol dehydratase family glycyl radical enzyme